MPFRSAGFDPETIAFLQECLDIATAAAARVGNVPASEETRRTLAAAIIEGATSGIASRDELVDFALTALPPFRRALAN